ncbi:hypothetical protein [Paraflavitalea sp. CAU 1676]|uniref:hypothetical protein n=1 Tax=Paraflavitalea sp. CAU 1676 TaxID=3032598 RepID=UPI0023DC53F4|nr:hypothetical protein [Paraflavitalea sp. CAU 1676]MDF2188519.1 hypothetical protein [Paraflavitalea sp. CAU 1676]
MHQPGNQPVWTSIPLLHCLAVNETLKFWNSLGYSITHQQSRPYQYGAIERQGHQLHFYRFKDIKADNNQQGTCLVIVPDAQQVYEDFTRRLKKALGKVPHTGLPRISRMKPGTTRFTLTDIAGNSVIFITLGVKDAATWEKAENKEQTMLQKAIAMAIRFRDYKNDDPAAAKTLDAALKKSQQEQPQDLAEALIIRIELAVFYEDKERAAQCEKQLANLGISEEFIKALRKKHFPAR